MQLAKAAALCLIACYAASLRALAQPSGSGEILSAPVTIEREAPVAALPVEIRAGKLNLHAKVNGEDAAMVFDTGSPTILSRQLADRLGLEVVGQNTGVDANGRHVTMDIAILDSLALGEVTFRNVPVLIHDFSALALGDCFLRDGVLGSEIYPGSAWQIDLGAGEVRIAESAEALGIAGTAPGAPLYDFGYPHAPIIDYSVGKLKDKALFDTGSGESVSLFTGAMDSPAVKKATVRNSKRSGRGMEGVSAGGRGEIMALHALELKSMTLGGQTIGPLRAVSRSVPPSLIGAGLLASHTVTLDYPGNRFLLAPRVEPAAPEASRDYALMPGETGAEVVQLFDRSNAARAGLELGDIVTHIDGTSLIPGEETERCEKALWLADEFDPSQAADLTLSRNGEQIHLHIGNDAG